MKRTCKACKTKFEVKRDNQIVCSYECSQNYAIILRIKKEVKDWKERKQQKKKELMTLSDWLKIAQTHFNTYIRLRDKGNNCISCGKKALKENAGHFYSSGGHYNVRFNENNVHLQCEYCNTYLSGNLINYRENLIKKIGYEMFENLTFESQITRNFTIQEVQEIAEIYKQKVRELKNGK